MIQATALPLAIDADGSLVLAVIVILVLAIAYGLYTRQGSGISNHPIDDTGPSQHPERAAQEDLDQPGIDQSGGPDVTQRGTDTRAG